MKYRSFIYFGMSKTGNRLNTNMTYAWIKNKGLAFSQSMIWDDDNIYLTLMVGWR